MIGLSAICVFQVTQLESLKYISNSCENPEVAVEEGKDDVVSVLGPKCFNINTLGLQSTLSSYFQISHFHDVSLTVLFVEANNWSELLVCTVCFVERQIGLLFE